MLASHSSLKDNTLVVNYAPGQAKGVVSGNRGMTPHSDEITRRSGSEFNAQFKVGIIPARFDLQPLENGSGYIETERQNPTLDIENDRLDRKNLQQLYNAVTTLENRLFCPVDVEFGIDMKDQLHLFQVRPVTRLSGAMNFTMRVPENRLISGK